MSPHAVTYAVRALTWMREDGYVKVPHPVSRRVLFLPGRLGSVFELVDEGLNSVEIAAALAEGDPTVSAEQVDRLVARLVELELIGTVAQFE